MEPEKKRWVVLVSVSLAIALVLGGLIYQQLEEIAAQRTTVAGVKREIASARELIKKTPDLVKEVIIRRETDETIKGILSNQEDINNFIRTIDELQEASKVTISAFRDQPNKGKKKDKKDFDRVRYTLQLEADIFQFLNFISKIESYPRLISVADFKLTSARRQSYEGGVEPRHRITLDLETYVYTSATKGKQVRIDNYDRKRDLLVSEISKRRSEILVPAYEYHGQQGRRDPWVDPRVPVSGPDAPLLSIEEQIAIVDDLVKEAGEVDVAWTEVASADNLIADMRARSNCERELLELEEQIRKVQSSAQISFVPAARRMDREVILVAQRVRESLTERDGRGQGPTIEALKLVIEAMDRHIEGGLFEAALETLADIEPRLPMAEREPRKQPFVAKLYEMRRMLETVLEFEKIDLVVQGIALYEDRAPVALINGVAVTEGELIDNELLVLRITIDQVEFSYRGIRVGRQLDEFMNRAHSK